LGLDKLRVSLRRHRRVAFDSCIFIYQIEANPKYVTLTDLVFSWLVQPAFRAVTSAITMTEVLVPSYRNRDQKLLDNFYGLLSTYPNLEWISVGLEIADVAAELRAQHNMRTPDAIHAATAIHAGATALITNDPLFSRISDFDVVILDDYV
jgi:predicted nucleic acid-binding protein